MFCSLTQTSRDLGAETPSQTREHIVHAHHTQILRPLAGSQPAKVSMGIWTALGSFWVWELVKFHQTQDTMWEQDGLSEGENNAPEGSKSTKNKNVFV